MSKRLIRSLAKVGAAALCCLALSPFASAQTTAPTGACCVTSSAGAATCSVITRPACRTAGGHYQGNSVACAADGSCPPRGACCFMNGRCEQETQAHCTTESGTWQTAGSVCSPNPCPQPTRGACCLTERNHAFCAVITTARCTSAGGAYQGDNIACTTTLCPQPVLGACCITRHNHAFCAVATSARCTTAGGTYQGDAVACTTTLCPQPVVGACCIAATSTVVEHCTIGTAAACTTAAGTYSGDASTCRSASCPTTCPCDYDHDGYLSIRDFHQFFDAWLAGNADYNNSGATDRQDLIDFYDCYQNAPTGCTRATHDGH